MTEEELEALAHRVAQYLRSRPDILGLDQSDYRQLLPLADAITAVHLVTKRPFYRWCKAYRVTAFRHGQYRRQDLIDGLAREEGAAKVKARRRARPKPGRPHLSNGGQD